VNGGNWWESWSGAIVQPGARQAKQLLPRAPTVTGGGQAIDGLIGCPSSCQRWASQHHQHRVQHSERSVMVRTKYRDPPPPQTWPRPSGSSSFLILMAKSEMHTIDGQHELENQLCQRTSSCETDFAISIAFGDVVWWVGMACLFRSAGRTLYPWRGSPYGRTILITTRLGAGEPMMPPCL
jgi:hypothetical protein